MKITYNKTSTKNKDIYNVIIEASTQTTSLTITDLTKINLNSLQASLNRIHTNASAALVANKIKKFIQKQEELNKQESENFTNNMIKYLNSSTHY